MKLALSSIRIDGGTQPRAELSTEAVERYRDEMESGAKFPQLTVFHDGSVYWLADGFHRYHAALELKIVRVDVDVRQGTRREAVLFSVGANATHGFPRSPADKRRAVETLLHDEEWGKRSGAWIAKACAVHQTTVDRIKNELKQSLSYVPPEKTVGLDGKTRKRPERKPAPAAAAPSSPPAVGKPPATQMRQELIEAGVEQRAAERTADFLSKEITAIVPRAIAKAVPAKTTKSQDWAETETHQVSEAMSGIRTLVERWPVGRSFQFLVDSLRNYATLLEKREQKEGRNASLSA